MVDFLLQTLKRICIDNALPESTAAELLCFFSMCLSLFGGDPIFGGVSPSEYMDRLWHIVLLETDLRNKVTSSVGGEVRHSTVGSRDPDEAKVTRRLRAMNLMREMNGERPLEAWRVPGSLMQTVENADGVYVLGAVASTSVEAPARKKQKQHEEKVITVRCGFYSAVRTSDNATLQDVVLASTSQLGLTNADLREFRFLFDGEVLNPSTKLYEAGIEEGDILDVVPLQKGC